MDESLSQASKDKNRLLYGLETISKTIEGQFGPLVQLIGIVLIVLVFNFIIKTILLKLQSHFQNKRKLWAYSGVAAIQKPLTFLVWFIAALSAVDVVTSSLFDAHVSSMLLFISIASILALGWFLLRWNSYVVRHLFEMSENNQLTLNRNQLDILSKLITIIVIIITVFLLMDATGRNMQTLIAFGGIGGLALAFASQQVISNFFGGLMVYMTQPFTLGEWIVLPEKKIEGHIEEIGWYLTRIRSFEKRPIYVPNSIFTQTVVITPSRMSHERFFHKIELRYQDIRSIKGIMDKIKLMLVENVYVDRRLRVEVYLKNFGETGLEIEISAYIAIKSDIRFPSIREDLLLRIAEIIEEGGAELAVPMSVVALQDLRSN